MPASLPPFEWSDRGSGLNVLACHGGVTIAERAALLESASQYLAARPRIRGLVVDLGDVDNVDSAGVGTLFQITTRVREHGGRTLLAHASRPLQHLLDAVGLTRLASLVDSVDDAVVVLGAR